MPPKKDNQTDEAYDLRFQGASRHRSEGENMNSKEQSCGSTWRYGLAECHADHRCARPAASFINRTGTAILVSIGAAATVVCLLPTSDAQAQGYDGWILGLSVTRDGKLVIPGDLWGSTVRVFDAATGELESSVRASIPVSGVVCVD
jgi:hypothetical protein